MPLNLCSNLVAVVDELAGQPGFEQLPKMLATAALVSACATDLHAASDILNALNGLVASSRSRGQLNKMATESGLLVAAVHYYCRATAIEAKGSERGCSKIANELTDKQREDHYAIVNVRHRGLTHVTNNAAIGPGLVWNESAPIAIEIADRAWKVAISTRHIGFNRALHEQLQRQVPISIAIMDRRFHRRIEAFQAKLMTATDLEDLFHRHLIDPIQVFGSEAAAEAAIRPIYSGAVTSKFLSMD